ncbi:PTS system, cellobiose-specific IIC component [Seinonella peptonophila]|uniref:Permease IIC component n=1 Tax=Seinonella peptonophila TaxID=112248 RepID=A0A1M4V4V9_9BACL|nr:PTS transporter subunit EIIC [Seinonella peptonophila]SHE63932.1 PTS system, cellobiose-specific IIC component [Seinonella peptonophila]
MEKLIHYMQNTFAPKVNKITKNIWIASIQDSVMAILPFILVGSLITMISLINELKPGLLPDFSLINSFSFGMVGIFVAYLIPYNVMDKNKINDKKTLAGLTSVTLYLMLISPVIAKDGKITFLFERFGATGMFVSIIIGLIVGFVMLQFAKFSFFKKESSLPDFIIVWFDSLLPITILLFAGWLVAQLKFDFFNLIVTIFQPLSYISQSFWGVVVLSFIMVFFYSFGISTWVLNPITFPIMVKAIADNAAMVQKGLEPTNIFTQEVYFSGWMAAGGIGFTLTLGILLLFARSSRLKAIGRATIAPSIFNINEPIVFGAPIVFNPILMIPFWINGTLIPAITYLVLKAGWVAIPYKAFQLWYIPYPISTYMVNGDWRGVILFFVLAALSLVIWYPFFKIYDNQELKLEASEEV